MTVITVSGIRFTDPELGRIALIQGGQWHSWIVRDRGDDFYLPYRKATESDQAKFARAVEEGNS